MSDPRLTQVRHIRYMSVMFGGVQRNLSYVRDGQEIQLTLNYEKPYTLRIYTDKGRVMWDLDEALWVVARHLKLDDTSDTLTLINTHLANRPGEQTELQEDIDWLMKNDPLVSCGII
jgi:hypothetical protein